LPLIQRFHSCVFKTAKDITDSLTGLWAYEGFHNSGSKIVRDSLFSEPEGGITHPRLMSDCRMLFKGDVAQMVMLSQCVLWSRRWLF